MASRPTPFDLVFSTLAAERFPALRESLAHSGLDAEDPDAFVLDREAAQLLREMVPDDSPAGAVTQHITLLHHAYLFWRAGRSTFRLSRVAAEHLLGPSQHSAPSTQHSPLSPPPSVLAPLSGLHPQDAALPRACYIQFPERLVWARLAPDEPHEPFDGMFLRPRASGFFVLGVFGLHPGREGFSVVDVEGYRPEVLEREDGTAPFSPVLTGGAMAGLFSLVGEDEFLELAARSLERIAAVSPPAADASSQVTEIA